MAAAHVPHPTWEAVRFCVLCHAENPATHRVTLRTGTVGYVCAADAMLVTELGPLWAWGLTVERLEHTP